MRNLTTFLSSVFALMGFSAAVNAQCGNVTVDVATDSWGYECYWEYSAQGNPCGSGTLGTYGNTAEIGCAGGGLQVATGGGYGDNTTTTETLGCLAYGCYTVNYVDDYGDGGATFTVYVDGNTVATFTGTGVGGSFDFCVAPAATYDAGVTAVTMTSDEFYMMPITHLSAGLTVEGDISNLGANSVTNAMITAVVYDGVTPVSTQNSTPITLATGTSQTETLTPHVPANAGTFAVVLTSSIAEADEDASNDMNGYLMDVTDSILARDNDTLAGSLGIGALQENGRLGQTFSTTMNDVLTSATAYLTGPILGDSTRFVVYAMTGGVPGAVLAQSDAHVFTAADTAGMWLTLPLTSTVNVTAGTDFLICVAEYDNNITLGTNLYNVVAGTNWVNWDTNPQGGWANAEVFGPQFAVQYILRANFGGGCAVDASTTTTGADIMANTGGATYTWLDCNNGMAAIAGETSQTLSTTVNGSYAVVVDNGSCSDTSACVTMLYWGLDEINMTIGVSPNPTNDKVSVDVPEALIGSNFIVVDQMGRTAIEGSFTELSNTVNMKSLENGVYFIKVEDQNITVRVVKQ